jgi:hypothetical protein
MYLCVDNKVSHIMRNRSSLIFGLILISFGPVFCQETNYGPGYQAMIINNPAFAGSSLDGTIRISYMNFYPGNHYNFHSVFLSSLAVLFFFEEVEESFLWVCGVISGHAGEPSLSVIIWFLHCVINFSSCW